MGQKQDEVKVGIGRNEELCEMGCDYVEVSSDIIHS
jgi:hypothetical protein